ncbi:hypothetical protein R5W24_000126 [Gemmata sp. JC717]|uniref:hypothetical protein n=1 Tax=Gemmata algarum TaxID=2975278 RepID=UPI0021BA4CE4|nr:hypothetical protein [Gemmata algarum]MDY3551053.1 hypothetical protein [Gemmata algarum]
MRAFTSSLILVGGIFLLGGAADAQDKKERKKAPLQDPYTEYVTVKRYAGQKSFEFNNPQVHVHAYRTTSKDGKQQFTLPVRGEGAFVGGTPPLKSQIIDKDGDVWVVVKHIGSGGDYYRLEVTKKVDK